MTHQVISAAYHYKACCTLQSRSSVAKLLAFVKVVSRDYGPSSTATMVLKKKENGEEEEEEEEKDCISVLCQESDSLLIHPSPIELFWSHIHRRAIVVGHSQAGFGGVLDPADAKVGYLGSAISIQQNVAWLQIPVDDAWMEVCQTCSYILCYLQDLHVAQPALGSVIDALMQVATLCHLHNKAHICLVLQAATSQNLFGAAFVPSMLEYSACAMPSLTHEINIHGEPIMVSLWRKRCDNIHSIVILESVGMPGRAFAGSSRC